MDFKLKNQYTISDLLEIVKILREPGGCPWDREQTHQSIRKNLIEETYEVAEAIDTQDAPLLCEELGDLLLQIALHVRMEEERGQFTFDDVCDGICKKLIHRHPHVFGDLAGDLSTGQVLDNWEKLKNEEKGRQTAAQRLDSVPKTLPALMYSAKVQKRAADFGFAYPDVQAAFADLDSEVAECRQSLADVEQAGKEIGDVLFSAVNVARLLDVDPEEALTQSCARFKNRVRCIEQLAGENGKELAALEEDELDLLWKKAKQREG